MINMTLPKMTIYGLNLVKQGSDDAAHNTRQPLWPFKVIMDEYRLLELKVSHLLIALL